MIGDITLIKLLNKYGIDGKKLIENNSNVLDYGNYEEIEEILKYLIYELNCEVKNVEKCPSILYISSKNVIENNYNYLLTTEIDINNVKKALSCLCCDYQNLQYNYQYLKNKIGVNRINECITCLNIESSELVKICEYFEKKFGIEKLRECISGISGIYSNFVKVRTILDLEIFKEKTELLTASVFIKDAKEIEKIVSLEIFKEKTELLTATVFRKDAKEIEKIVSLEIFKGKPELLTATVFQKDAKEIENIVSLEIFKEKPELITASVFQKDAKEIENIVSLEIFKEKPELLTASVFIKDAKSIQEKYDYIIYELNNPDLLNPTIMYRITMKEFIAKLNYLESNNIDVVDERGKINSIFGMSNKKMQKNYGISKKELIEQYYKINRKEGNMKIWSF